MENLNQDAKVKTFAKIIKSFHYTENFYHNWRKKFQINYKCIRIEIYLIM